MNYTTIGSLGNYMKNLKLQGQWQRKKDAGNYTEKMELQKILNPDKAAAQEYVDKMHESSADDELSNILLKLKSGGKLSTSEMEYLKEKSPTVYQEAKEIEQERASYENALKNCKTKEDVQRLKTARVGAALSTINAVTNNPNIPKSQKLATVMGEFNKMQAVNDAEREFIESGAYSRLATDAERNEAIHEKAEAEKEQLAGENKEEKVSADEITAEEIAKEESTAGENAAEEIPKEQTKKEPSGTAPADADKKITANTDKNITESKGKTDDGAVEQNHAKVAEQNHIRAAEQNNVKVGEKNNNISSDIRDIDKKATANTANTANTVNAAEIAKAHRVYKQTVSLAEEHQI